MAVNQTRSWLLCYDIADPRRLGRVHRRVRQYSVPIQYSVYLIQCSPSKLQKYLAEIDALIDARSDDIRVYPIPSNPEIALIGSPPLPDGMLISGDDPLSRLITTLQAMSGDTPLPR